MADSHPPENTDKYPISVFRFKASIGDAEIYFSEISGLNMGFESTEYKKVDQTIQVMGQRNMPSLTMKRGLFKGDLDLYRWLNQTHTSDFKKKDVVVELLDNENNDIMTWTISNTFCNKFEGFSLDATSDEVSFQTIELKGDTIKVDE